MKTFIKNITFEEILLPIEPEPNTAMPRVTVTDKNVELSFDMRGPDWPDSDATAKMLFVDCLMYRIGSPNEDGLYFGSEPGINNDSIYSYKNFPSIKLHTFYKVHGLNWKEDLLGKETVIVQNDYKQKDNYNHFIFFMKDSAFECVAKEYKVLDES